MGCFLLYMHYLAKITLHWIYQQPSGVSIFYKKPSSEMKVLSKTSYVFGKLLIFLGFLLIQIQNFFSS